MYRTCRKDYSQKPSLCIFKYCKYLRSIVDYSVIVCDKIRDKIRDVRGSVSAYVTSTISTNVKRTASINFDDKNI